MQVKFRTTSLILLCLILAAVTGCASMDFEQAGREGRRGDFIKELKETKVVVERSYEYGDEVNLNLEKDQAAHLNFTENPAGIREFIFWNDGGRLVVILGCEDEEYDIYSSNILNSERPRDFRISSSSEASYMMECVTEWNAEGDHGTVTFRSKLLSPDEFKRRMNKLTESKLARLQRVLEWDYDQRIAPIEIIMDDPNDPNLIRLRSKYQLDKLVSDATNDYQKLQRIVKWVHDQWKHSGENRPSRSDPLTILEEASAGKRFRCVEYSIVLAACARTLGMPSRVLALKRPDVESAESGAGHVVAEVWLNQFNKWVFADGQMDAIPEKNGIPLNAVEFQDAIAQNAPDLIIRSSSGTDRDNYIIFAGPYLFYFDFNLDQRFFVGDYEKRRYDPVRGKIILVPKGAKQPTVFQRETPIKNCTYISNPNAFYPKMSKEDERAKK